MFDYIIVGSGFAGSVVAERIASIMNKKILIIEKRSHIGGNCYDYFDANSLLIHKYGPHIFHTQNKKIWDYLSRFTEWNLYNHQVLGVVDGKKIPIPFNLESLEQVFPKHIVEKMTIKLIDTFGYNFKVSILELKETKDKDLKFLANYIYDKIFLNYTTKQWGLKPEELSASVTGRIPVYISKDTRYFQDPFQGTPKEGYTKLFERILDHPNIKILLNTDAKEIISLDDRTKKIFFMKNEFKGNLIYTGSIDELFNFEFGEMPYRSLRFDFKNIPFEYFQETGQINYPNNYNFTRITEFKHLTTQKHFSTTIAIEYPQNYDRKVEGKDVPYYPIPKKETNELYQNYYEKAQKFSNLILVGRLADYKYYNMDVTVSKALEIFEKKILKKNSIQK